MSGTYILRNIVGRTVKVGSITGMADALILRGGSTRSSDAVTNDRSYLHSESGPAT